MTKPKRTNGHSRPNGPSNSTAGEDIDRNRGRKYDPSEGGGGGWPYNKGKPLGGGKPTGGGRPYPEPPSIEPPENWR